MSDPPFHLVRGVSPSVVDLWSTKRLPFEPTGPMLDMRSGLRTELGQLRARTGEGLHATFESADRSPVDAENVLLYNVGTGAFAGVDLDAVTIERGFAFSDAPPQGLPDAAYRSVYTVSDDVGSYTHWVAGRVVAEFGPINLTDGVRSSSSVWFRARPTVRVLADPDASHALFGLHVRIASASPGLHLAAIVKPLVDGVIAAMHTTDLATAATVEARIASVLGADEKIVRSALLEGPAPLGPRRLAWPWRAGVQWNPADDRCVALTLVVDRGSRVPTGRDVVVSGELLEVAARAGAADPIV